MQINNNNKSILSPRHQPLSPTPRVIGSTALERIRGLSTSENHSLSYPLKHLALKDTI